MTKVKIFIKQTGVAAGYIIAAAIPAGSNFILTLVLVRSLGIDGFAEWAIIEPLLLIGAAATTFGTQFGALNAAATRMATAGSILSTGLAISFSASFLVAITGGFALSQAHEASLGVAFGAALCADALAAVSGSLLRGQNRPGALAAFECLRSFGTLLVVSAIYWFYPSWIETPAQFLMYRFAATMIAISGTVYLVGLELPLKRQLAIAMIRYGLPLLGANLIALVMTNVDRYFLTFLGLGPSTVASYVAHQRLAGILNVAVVTPLQLWFPAETMRRVAHVNESFFRGVTLALLACLVAIECLALIAAPIAWPFLFPQIRFEPLLFLLLSASVIPQALAIAVNIGALQPSKTNLNILGAAIGCGTNIIMGLLLTFTLGAVGAAAARLLSFTTYMLAFRAISHRIVPVSYSMKLIAPFGAAFVLVGMIPFAERTGVPVWISAPAGLALAVFGLINGRKEHP